jgi:penicillin-binding protein 2
MRKRRIAIADHAAEAILFNRRVLFSFCVVVLLFGILLLNLYQLQVVKYAEYSTRADGNRIKLVPLSPNRGMIFDRNGVLLAENSPVSSLELVPEQVPDLTATVAELASLIQIDAELQQEFFKQVKQQRRFKSIALKEHLTEQEVAILAVQLHRFSGVTLEARLTRNYPYGDLLTHAIGYIGKINEKEYKALEDAGVSANYAASRDIGKVGLEKFYETELHGTVGYQEVEVNSRGRVIRTLREQPGVSGDDLFLSLDLGMQLKAQEALGENRGSVVVLDPRDGAVLAFYSNPSYNPNLFVHGISGKNYRMLLNSPDRPLVNRITQGLFPPASTIKPLLGVLGLENGTVTEHTRVPDPGFYRLPNVSRPWRDHSKYGHGYVDIYTGIIKSCDTYFYDLAYKLGIDKIADFMTKAGYGRPSGIDVHEESEGNMPTRAWKKARHKQNWGPGDTINIGIGQGYWQATPLQMALTTATLINNGARLKPRLGRYFHNQQQDQTLLQPFEQAITVVNPDHWAISREAMRRTAQQEGGTARAAFLGARYNPAGKTGTQQVINIAAGQKYNAKAINERHRDNAMFIGYAPHDKPEIVVAVVVENAGGGGSNAAPVGRMMMDYYFTPVDARPPLPTLAEIAALQQQRADDMQKREQRYAEEKAEQELRKKKQQQAPAAAEMSAPAGGAAPLQQAAEASNTKPQLSTESNTGAAAVPAQTVNPPAQLPARTEDNPIDE